MTSRIIYSVIIRGNKDTAVTLTEYAVADGSYRQFVKTVASKVSYYSKLMRLMAET
jgi:hypothetical protein